MKVMREQELVQCWMAVHQQEGARTSKASTREGEDLAISALHTQYNWLVKYVMKIKPLNYSVVTDPDDHYQNGGLGLIEAIRNFDPEYGIKTFPSFAIPHIYGAMRDNERGTARVSRTFNKRNELIESVTDAFVGEHGTPPTEEELLVKCHEKDPHISSVQQLREAQRVAQTITISLDQPWMDSTNSEPHESIADHDLMTPEEIVIRAEEIERLVAATSTLSEREQRIIDLHYSREMTFLEISLILDVSWARVWQLHKRVIEKLRAQLEASESTNQDRNLVKLLHCPCSSADRAHRFGR